LKSFLRPEKQKTNQNLTEGFNRLRTQFFEFVTAEHTEPLRSFTPFFTLILGAFLSKDEF